MLGPGVERWRLQGREQLGEPADRVIGPPRIGGMALHSFTVRVAEKLPRRPILIWSPKRSALVGSPDDRIAEALAARHGPWQQLGCAVDRRSFLIAGDQEGDAPAEIVASPGDEAESRCHHCGEAAFHINRARP
jgi:hypothetical protein